MIRLVRPRIAVELALGTALIASLAVNYRQATQLAASRRQRAADLASLRALQEALRQRDLQKPPAEAAGETPAGASQAALAKREAAIERLNRELSEARAEIAQLQAQLQNSGDERDKALASADERYRKEQEDFERRLDELKQQLDSAEAESQASRERITALEAANAKLRSDQGEASGRAAEIMRVVADLQDLDRRREGYLTSIMRRYRDITSQFRAMGGMIDSGRDSNSNVLSEAALTRIQNAVSLADDDLRQLSDLNARARELQKKLAKK
jgi:chromosome segregation ATPase